MTFVGWLFLFRIFLPWIHQSAFFSILISLNPGFDHTRTNILYGVEIGGFITININGPIHKMKSVCLVPISSEQTPSNLCMREYSLLCTHF